MAVMILLTLLIVAIGLGVAYWNARIAGKIWLESKAVGGWIRVVAWGPMRCAPSNRSAAGSLINFTQ